MKLILNNQTLDAINTDFYNQYNFQDSYIYDLSGKEHYKLLVYLGKFFNRITELGTSRGYSSVALSQNPYTIIRSFDIENLIPESTELPLNIERFLCPNILNEKINSGHRYFMLNSDLIFMDTAHTGDYEFEIYNYLVKNNYKGLFLLDDIYLNREMIYFWNEISIKKYDITKYGHLSGTGLVDFSGKLELILE